MNVLLALLSREENRNKNMIDKYNLELESLPKGSIKLKKVNNKTYYYLIFRNGNRVITKYIGKNEQSVIPIKEKLVRRKQVEQMLKKLKEEQKKIKKLEATL